MQMTERSVVYDHRGLIDAVDASICIATECKRTLVYPMTSQETAIDGLTKVVLRCPDCEVCRSGYMDSEQVEYLDRFMDIGQGVVQGELAELSSASQINGYLDDFGFLEDEELQT